MGCDNKILGINLDIYDPGDAILRYTFLPMDLLCKRLKHFSDTQVCLLHLHYLGTISSVNLIHICSKPSLLIHFLFKVSHFY